MTDKKPPYRYRLCNLKACETCRFWGRHWMVKLRYFPCEVSWPKGKKYPEHGDPQTEAYGYCDMWQGRKAYSSC